MKHEWLKILAGAALLASGVALADPPEKDKLPGKAKGPHHEKHDSDFNRDDIGDLVRIGISRDEARRIARDEGFHGQKPLPPGIRKNMERGKPIPPGIQMTRAPASVYDRFPRYEGYDYRVAGSDLLLVEAGSNIIADMLVDVFD